MRRVLSVLASCILLWGAAEASVTDIKWGVDAQNNLRLVVDLTEPVDFTTKVENQTLVIKVKSPLDGESRTVEIASEFARSMQVQAAGAETIVKVPLTQVIAKEDIKTFTLKQDPVTKRPSRIVFDLLKKQVIPVLVSSTSGAEKSQTVSTSEQPKAAVPAEAPKTIKSAEPKINSDVNPKLIPASVVNSKGVKLSDPKQVAKIPEIKRVPAAVSQSNGSVVGNVPVKSAAPVKINLAPPVAGYEQSTAVTKPVASSAAAEQSSAAKSTMPVPKVIVGSSPANKEAIQAKSIQRGKEAVADIIGKNKVATAVTTVKTETSETPTAVPVIPAPSASVPSAVGAASAVNEVSQVTSAKTETKKVKIKGNKKGEYRTGGGIKGKIITIDPGHGGTDPGAVSNKGTYEKTITLSMAKKLKEDLENLGATVYLTRIMDVEVAGKNAEDAAELQARVDIAEKHCSDLFISLHINASVNKKATGISTYYYAKTNHDEKLANAIHKQLTSNFGLNDMGVRQANFYVTKRCCMPAVLMELGFITNAKEEKTIKGNWFQNKAMDLVAKGIRDYFK